MSQWEALSELQRVTEVFGRIAKSAGTPTSMADLGNAGKLVAEQADQFMITAQLKAALLKDMTILTMKSSERYIPQMSFGTPVMFPAEEGYALTSDLHSKPTFDGPKLTAKETRAVFQLTDQAVRESISGEQLLNDIMEGGTVSFGRDMENVLINGNTATVGTTPLAIQLRTLDGFRVQANTSAHVYDHAADFVGDDLFDNMEQALPAQYHNPGELVFYVGHKVWLQYKRFESNRMTPQGDTARRNAVELEWGGIPVRPLQLMDQAHGTSNKCSDAFLTNPKNFVLGVRDEVTIEFARNARAKMTDIIFSARWDGKLAFPDALVVAQNVKNTV